jgi:hypothetical protein
VGEGHPRLSEPNRLRSDLRAMTADGAAFSVMVGVGETYLVPFALALGIAAGQASLLATLPILAGSLLQLVAPLGVRRLGSYRRWVVGCAALQALCFAPLWPWRWRGGAALVLLVVGATGASAWRPSGLNGGTIVLARLRALFARGARPRAAGAADRIVAAVTA